MTDAYYRALGLAPGASEADIKRAFHLLAKEYHPDRHAGDEAFIRKFKEVNDAYTALKNLRMRYYEELGVSRESTQAEIRTGYHRARMKYEQALKDGDAEAEEKLAFLKEAYERLKAPDSNHRPEGW